MCFYLHLLCARVCVCAHAYVHMEGSSQLEYLPLFIPVMFSHMFLIEPGASLFAWIATESIIVFLPGFLTLHARIFMWALEIKVRSSCLYIQQELRNSLSPSCLLSQSKYHELLLKSPQPLASQLPSSYHMLMLQPITDEKNVWDNQSAEPSVYGG